MQAYALVSIRIEEGGPVLRVRHFDAELAPREKKALTLKLVEKGDRFARFEGRPAGAAGPVTLAYKREGNMLTGSLTKDGKREEFDIQMKRWGAGPGQEPFHRRRAGEVPPS